MRVLVSGANGFIGSALCTYLLMQGHDVVPLVRRPSGLDGERVINVASALEGCEVVFHLAGLAHVLDKMEQSQLDIMRAANLDATFKLARLSVEAGVRRFVFVSTIKTMGEKTPIGGSYKPEDPPNPQDPYAISKYEAEQVLWEIAEKMGLEVVIVRPPLVYGPGVKANFFRLLKLVDMGIPIPFGAIKNARSLIYLDNLVDALIACAFNPVAAGQSYHVADCEPISTPQLINSIATALNRPNRNFSIPISFIRGVAGLLGKSNAVERLTQSLVVDSSKIIRELDWQPPYTMADGLRATAQWYQQLKSKS